MLPSHIMAQVVIVTAGGLRAFPICCFDASLRILIAFVVFLRRISNIFLLSDVKSEGAASSSVSLLFLSAAVWTGQRPKEKRVSGWPLQLHAKKRYVTVQHTRSHPLKCTYIHSVSSHVTSPHQCHRQTLNSWIYRGMNPSTPPSLWHMTQHRLLIFHSHGWGLYSFRRWLLYGCAGPLVVPRL